MKATWYTSLHPGLSLLSLNCEYPPFCLGRDSPRLMVCVKQVSVLESRCKMAAIPQAIGDLTLPASSCVLLGVTLVSENPPGICQFTRLYSLTWHAGT